MEREHLVPVEPLVHFFCRCVEHVCGDSQGVDGAGDLGMPDGFGGFKSGGGSGVGGGGGAGLTRSGAMTAWMRYRKSEQQENQEHQEHEHAPNTAAPPGKYYGVFRRRAPRTSPASLNTNTRFTKTDEVCAPSHMTHT